MKQVDYKLFFSVLFLIVFWMIMISSVSVYSSFRVTDIMARRWFIEEAYNHFYVLRNISHVIISMIMLGIIVKVPYKFFEKYSKYFFLVTIVWLIVVLLVWTSLNGARWWISIPGIPFTIQPTEFLKFTLIIYLAYFFKRYKAKLHTFSDGFLPFVLILSGLIFLIGSQPDFGTIMVIIPIAFIMFFMAGWNVRYLITFMILGMVLSSSVYFAGKYDKSIPEDRNKLSYITDRIDNFLADPEEIIKNKTINYQTEQALIAIGSWGFNWLWFGKSIQKFWYLPEVQWDFIFSVIVEELWFIWALWILSLYLYIGSRWLYIYRHVKDLFAKYVAIWVSSWILMQAFINIWVNLNIVPLTWITLPFVSYGGSSLLSLSLWLALLLNVSRSVEDETGMSRIDRKKRLNFIKKSLWN